MMLGAKAMPKINPRVDFAFKILFGSEENTDILLPFINSVLSLPNPLTELTLLNPYNHKTHLTDKLSILDIKARDGLGHLYNIEMQMTDQVSYSQRALYYWSKLYSQQLKEGEDFAALNKTISIHVLNFNHFDEPDYHNIYHVLNAKTKKRSFEDLELHFIELKKFNKELSHLTTALDRWTTFLSKAEQWERNFIPEELKIDPAIEKAAQALDTLSLDEEEREIYEAKLKWLRDESGTFKKIREEGREEGREETKHEVALSLIKRSALSLEEVSDITGLSKEVLESMKEKSE
jgi:predicted transposase/invertase (TIGR01784 family)